MQHMDNHFAMITQDDNSLLRSIAHNRDSDAFTELYQRYGKCAFGIAFRILRNPALAEDAVQEAMLSIWCWTKPFQPKDAKRWILSIVTAKSFDLARNQKRNARREEYAAMEPSQPTPVAEEFDSELIAALRTQIDNLPNLECQLLACSFGASMSHRQIAELVGVSQPTVSSKIQHVIERLRAELMKAGVAAAMPLSAGVLLEALTSGHECPPELQERILQHVDKHRGFARSLSRRGPAGKASRWAPTAVVVVIAAVTCALGWTFGRRSVAPPAIAPSSSNADAPVSAPFSRTWNFNVNGQTSDLKVVEGAWQWKSKGGPDGSGCMETTSDNFIAEIDLPSAKTPLCITYKFHAIPVTPARAGYFQIMYWSARNEHTLFDLHNCVEVDSGDWPMSKHFVTSEWAAQWLGGHPISLMVGKRLQGSKLRIHLRGLANIDDITVREIRPEELPDVQKYFDALQKIDPSKRTGTVVLPGMKSQKFDEPMTVSFGPIDLILPK